MGYKNKIFVLSIIILAASILTQDYMPEFITGLIKFPSVKHVAEIISKTMQNPAYIIDLFGKDDGKGKKKTGSQKKGKAERFLTVEELEKYNGKEGSKGLYLAILGRVYDVKKGKKHYGPGGGYEFFSGRDGSRAFVSGDFTKEGLIDDITGLTSQDYLGLDDWVKLYDKDYKYVGKLIGRYYDSKGNPTPYYSQVQQWISDAYAQKESENQEKKIFPPCNSEWSEHAGSKVYCTSKSGGIERDWVGVPRKLFLPGKTQERCACVKNFGPPSHDPTRKPHNNRGDLDHPNVKEYSGCEEDQVSCHIENK